MATVYLGCAIVGVVLLLCQFVMTLTGLGGDELSGGDHDFGGGDHDFGGGDHDMGGADHDVADGEHHVSFFSVLSFRSLVAAVAFFGLGGMAADESGLPAYATFVVGLGAGLAALFIVAWLMHLLYGLHDEGNVRIQSAVGTAGTVYLSIPGHREGAGKVTVKVQHRTMEYTAFTDGDPLPTGTPVEVTGLAGSSALEVERLKD